MKIQNILEFLYDIDNVKNIVTIISLCIGSYVALNGLSTWKRQLVAQSEQKLARRILISVYKFRDALITAYYSIEGPFPSSEEIIQERLTKLSDIRDTLRVELLEAEPELGDNDTYSRALDKLLTYGFSLPAYYNSYLHVVEVEYAGDVGNKNPYDENFPAEFDKLVKEIEGILRQKIRIKKAEWWKFWHSNKANLDASPVCADNAI